MKSRPPEYSPSGGRRWKAPLSIIIIGLTVGLGAIVVIQWRENRVPAPNPLRLPAAPESYAQLVQKLVPLSSNESVLRISGYKTIRVDVTNRLAGYSRSANFTQDRFGQWNGGWDYSSPSVRRELQVYGPLTSDEVFAIRRAVDTNTYGRIHRIMSAEKGVAHVWAGNFGPLSGQSFDLLVLQTQGVWRFAGVESERWH